jgi:putative RecB family exonuclease
MALPLPSSLTPSKVASFKDCALAFRFSAIDRLPEAPSPAATKGTLVHRVLERLFWEFPQGERQLEGAKQILETESRLLKDSSDWTELGLSDDDFLEFVTDSQKLVDNYFTLEDPNAVSASGTELMLESKLGDLKLRGIIDRLDLNEQGELVVVDYKTGRAPGEKFEAGKLGGVHFYAYLCEQLLGRRPAKVKLLYLREPVSISMTPSEQSIKAMSVRASAVWSAVERACEREDFRPNPGRMCSWCSFQEFCPAKGGQLPDPPRLDKTNHLDPAPAHS